MRVAVIIFCILAIIITILGSTLLGLSFAIIPCVIYTVQYTSDSLDNQKEMIKILKEIQDKSQ